MLRRAGRHVQTLFKVNDSEPRKRLWTSRKYIILGSTKIATINSGELLTVNKLFHDRFAQNPKHQEEYVYIIRKPRKGNNTKATQRQQPKSLRPPNYNFRNIALEASQNSSDLCSPECPTGHIRRRLRATKLRTKTLKVYLIGLGVYVFRFQRTGNENTFPRLLTSNKNIIEAHNCICRHTFRNVTKLFRRVFVLMAPGTNFSTTPSSNKVANNKTDNFNFT